MIPVAHGPAVYLCRDGDGAPLYAGATSYNVHARLGAHASAAPWWKNVATVEIEPCATTGDAYELEAAIISDLAPPHNRGPGYRRPHRAGERHDRRRQRRAART